MLYKYAAPTKFQKLAKSCAPWMLLMSIFSLAIGLYYALFNSPVDYQQKETVRIMYVHVPAAWMALSIYVFMGVSSIFFIVWRHTLAAYLTKAAAPIGACFTLISLVTGSLWGKPMWGAWWVWDARLTSVLVLFFLYVGYMLCANYSINRQQGFYSGAVLSIIGCINIPIIKFSVDWWNTLHQGSSIFKTTGPSIHHSMMVPLLWMAVGFLFLFVYLLLLRTLNELAEQKLLAITMRKVQNNA